MYKVELADEAQEDYEQSIRWYNERSYQASENFVNAIEETLDLISKLPHQFKTIKKGYHEVIVHSFPFTIVYKIEEAEKLIAVTAVHHQSRNPKRKLRQSKK